MDILVRGPLQHCVQRYGDGSYDPDGHFGRGQKLLSEIDQRMDPARPAGDDPTLKFLHDLRYWLRDEGFGLNSQWAFTAANAFSRLPQDLQQTLTPLNPQEQQRANDGVEALVREGEESVRQITARGEGPEATEQATRRALLETGRAVDERFDRNLFPIVRNRVIATRAQQLKQALDMGRHHPGNGRGTPGSSNTSSQPPGHGTQQKPSR
ncbi:hypothetical protein [Micromonospora sp. SH-82]|uniref:hypothetical protein n=1 Tax=Micromonospora sp. SH-82 TaxID=3132938 RepID=UPI003EBA9A96